MAVYAAPSGEACFSDRTTSPSAREQESSLYFEQPRVRVLWHVRYVSTHMGKASRTALAATHHHLAWEPPFADDNEHPVRLHALGDLHAMGRPHPAFTPL